MQLSMPAAYTASASSRLVLMPTKAHLAAAEKFRAVDQNDP